MKGLVGITVTDLANEMLNQRKKKKEGKKERREGTKGWREGRRKKR